MVTASRLAVHPHHATEQLQRQWHTKTAGGFGFADDDPAILAVGAVLTYLQETRRRRWVTSGRCASVSTTTC